MAIIFPIRLPSSPAPRSFAPRADVSVGKTISPWTFSEQVQKNQGQRLVYSLDLPPMVDAMARAWWGKMLQLDGPVGTFYFGDPKWKAPTGTWAGSPVVDGPGQSGQTLAMRGFTAGATVRAGDYFQLGTASDSRLYVVIEDGTADGSGELQMEIWPALRVSPQDGDTPITSLPVGVFRLADASATRSWEPFRHGFAFSVVEVVE